MQRGSAHVHSTGARRPARAPLARWALCCLLVLTGLAGCAEMQPKRYGVDELRFKGMDDMDPAALKACLATVPREKLDLGLGALSTPECGVPPFDEARASRRWFAWGWKEWPIYDEAIFRLDMERITRWYRARGYYDARVADVQYDPPEAGKRDENEQCSEGCELEITVVVEEGEPVLVRKVELRGVEQLNQDLQEDLRDTLIMKPGSRFDESIYDQAKAGLEKELREVGHARAKVQGEVVIARDQRAADIVMQVEPGPLCRIGKVRIESVDPVPTGPILNMALLHSGQLYRDSDLDDAQRSIYSLGSFSAVNVRPELDTGSDDVIDVVIEVEQRRKSQVQLGAGIMSGVMVTGMGSMSQISVPQWDVHLLGSYEHRNFVGGLRRFRIEDRPRMLFLAPFPDVPDNSPRFGNLITVAFSQPGVFEPRTTLFVEARADYGPDPFQLFFRNELGVAIGLERGFWRQRIKLRGAIHQEAMFVAPKKRQDILADQYPTSAELAQTRAEERAMGMGEMAQDMLGMCRESFEEVTLINADRPLCRRSLEEVLPSGYRLPFLEQQITVDLRDNAQNTSRGAYFALNLQQAFKLWEKGWNYLRVMPDLRGYVPLGMGMVLAARFAVGAIFIFDRGRSLDNQAYFNGPTAYRLRGGGAQSNRGFLPGYLGDSRVGGTRQWDASLEWRIPLAKSFSIVGFGDMGDVKGCAVTQADPPGTQQSCNPRFRWGNLNTTFGGGLRYRTIVGPIRLDVGYRPKKLQRADGGPGEEDTLNIGSGKFRGAVHLTIGEAF